MTPPDNSPVLALLIAAVVGFALNPFLCAAWAWCSDWIAAIRPAVWGYRTICADCRNAPEQREIHFRQRKPRARRMESAK